MYVAHGRDLVRQILQPIRRDVVDEAYTNIPPLESAVNVDEVMSPTRAPRRLHKGGTCCTSASCGRIIDAVARKFLTTISKNLALAKVISKLSALDIEESQAELFRYVSTCAIFRRCMFCVE